MALRTGICFLIGMLLAGAAVRADEPAKPVVILIDDEITDRTASLVETQINAAKEAKQKELRVRLDSPGGSIFDGLRIIRLLMDSELETTCEVEGVAASMAAVILESPACKKRVVRPWSIIMFHEASAGMFGGGHQNEAQARADALKAINRADAVMIAPRLRLSVEDFLSRTTGGKEFWVVGIDAIGLHVADEVKS